MAIKAYAALKAGGKLEPFEYDPGELAVDQVEIDIDSCGICHSDLSMLNNDWEMAKYPLVPGHEIAGKVGAVGERVTHVKPGQVVGLGWYSKSCMTCGECMSGNHNLCATAEGVIVGRHGGFANKVRAHETWVIPLPEGINVATAGPLFCGGITVFNPIIQNNIQPTDRVGVVGIGGLGHMAIRFLKAWGCEITAFSTSPAKEAEARELGAHHFVNSHDSDALAKLADAFDMILVTVNAELDWDGYISALGQKGKLHIVGAAPSVSAAVFPLILRQRSIGGSPLGSPATMATMLEFASRHGIEPVTETFPMSKVNDALEKLRTGKPRFRLVLENDLD
ncbi:MAG: NAD(P)-dependent alcohol dehydrogenase [Desulfobacterales bacterium]|nr:MAG: NAD(P)-dependent alcohol dehydrogenase [Desulfobacterales bacterium]